MYIVMVFGIIGMTIVFSIKVLSNAKLRELEQQGAEETMRHKFELDVEKEKTMREVIKLEERRMQWKYEYSEEYKKGVRNYW